MTDFTEELLQFAISIQQVPAPTFHEEERAELVRHLFQSHGAADISVDAVNNVYARIRGSGNAKPLIISAHLDTVFPEGTDLTVTRDDDRIHGPGIGDNSLGVATLCMLPWMLRLQPRKLTGDLWLVANSGEEGLGNLRGMKAVVDRFGAEVTAYLVLEGTALAHVYHRAIAVERYRITVRTPGGHSWSDYGQPSAIHELARMVTQMTNIPMPSSPRTSLNVGTIAGGTGINVVAPEAKLELDIRSEGQESLEWLRRRVQDIVAAGQRVDVKAEMEMIGQRPAGRIPQEHRLVRLAEQCLEVMGLKASFTSGSTDANVPLSRGIPALVLGVTTGGNAHTTQEYIDLAPVDKGMGQIMRFIERVFVE